MNGFYPTPQKYKCPKCGSTTIESSSQAGDFKVCKKCDKLMIPCEFDWFDKLYLMIKKQL